jgi:hypothetical protein
MDHGVANLHTSRKGIEDEATDLARQQRDQLLALAKLSVVAEQTGGKMAAQVAGQLQ